MLTKYGHLTYCTNIHPGESWSQHFEIIRKTIPVIKKSVAGSKPFGIGLRLSNSAAEELSLPDNLTEFKTWLDEENCYVFTMNGFPYGNFHQTFVKDQVHVPDWTNESRLNYTIRLFDILFQLLPPGMAGGVSTSPLSYKLWFPTQEEKNAVKRIATYNIIKVAAHLNSIYNRCGTLLHIDIEPEPDGLLESGSEFIQWYTDDLIPLGVKYFSDFGLNESEAKKAIRRHVQLCYDVCHFAVGYERHCEVLQKLKKNEIQIGKVQISAALKADFVANNEDAVLNIFQQFDEPVYLHQVVAMMKNGSLEKYSDLRSALQKFEYGTVSEWRAHFHVPIFTKDYSLLKSTNEDIEKLFQLHAADPITNHLEIETYTWEILPSSLRVPIEESIIRECNWAINQLDKANVK